MPHKDPERRREYMKIYWKKYYALHYKRRPRIVNHFTPSERTKRWRKAHPERAKESAKRARLRYYHEGDGAAKQKAYREANKERYRECYARKDERRRTDPILLAKRRERDKDYYYRNRERRIANVKAYEIANAAKVRLWKQVRAARRRSKELSNGGSFTRQQWLWRLEFYGFRCAYCGCEVAEETAHIDHVIPVSKGGPNWPSNLVPSCCKCNLSKHVKSILPLWLRESA